MWVTSPTPPTHLPSVFTVFTLCLYMWRSLFVLQQSRGFKALIAYRDRWDVFFFDPWPRDIFTTFKQSNRPLKRHSKLHHSPRFKRWHKGQTGFLKRCSLWALECLLFRPIKEILISTVGHYTIAASLVSPSPRSRPRPGQSLCGRSSDVLMYRALWHKQATE